MSASLALTHLVPLAKDIDNDKVTPGVLGFVVFAALAVGVWLLMKSMNRHMGKVDFEEAPESGQTSPAAAAGASGKGDPQKA
ncbi:hypothetical protein [Streptomyces melanogenes]|uniref:hypothetical protein n=1 Tax=Streptomyces melanogenes TaxID=67326 RepID=UPI00167C5BD7|nr:hypothetical protein [Streptomyces melanogenes]GGP51200.1 hypothetical protein GCM10010278_29900 [Streptomyces melanogenes]